MDQKTESTTRRMDCSELLEHVLRTESFLPESADAYFGHPPPPKLSILDLDGISLMVSQTKRCVSAQIWKDSSIGEPDEVICMPPKGEVAPDDEIITALTLMTKNDRVAIVVGTSYSRILSVEVKINSSAPLLERFGPPFEPLPIETTNDSHDESSHSDSLSKSKHGSRADASGTDKKTVTFRPSGGVNHIEEYVIDSKNVVWISYKDGTLIRLPPESFFPSITNNNVVWKEHSDKLLRAQVMLPPGSLGTALFVMALPKHHPSPLAPLALGKPEDFDIIEPVSLNPEDGDDSVPEFHEALSYGGGAATGLGDLSPSLSFYTSEDQFLGRITGDAEEGKKLPSHDESVLFDNAIDATTAIVGGVFGAAMGVVKWGFRGGRGRKDIQPSRDIEVDFMLDSTEDQDPEARELFSTLHNEPDRLYPGYELHDAPRLVMSASIDPQGNLAATTDTLGRVLLIDLDTKQVVRMWKGVREASCCWMEGRGKKSKRKLYVVIHSRQRRTVEVWEARHGRKVLAMQVGRDAQLVPCKTRNFAGCMLLQSSRPGSAMNHLVLLAPNNNAANSETDMTLNASSPKTGSSTSIQAAAMRLQTLQQLLDNTNVPCQKQDVFEALTQVTALKDLCTALDLLSVSSSLEERMGVKGAEFQKLALTHCRALFDNSSGNSGADPNNPLMQTLSARITFHSQVS
jgi:Rab3 GTPase-activating protein regulatory subunit N-terminus